MYEVSLGVTPGAGEDPEAVQGFIDAERADVDHHPRYLGLYENRYLGPGDADEWCGGPADGGFGGRAALAAAHAGLWGGDFGARMAAHRARLAEREKLTRITLGTLEVAGGQLEHRGARHPVAAVWDLLAGVEAEVAADHAWMSATDRESFRVHRAMAAELGAADLAALEMWYRFHLGAQGVYETLVTQSREVGYTLAAVQGQRELEPFEFHDALRALRGAADGLRAAVAAADALRLPPLRHLPAGEPLGPLLLSEPVVHTVPADAPSLDGAWVSALWAQVSGARERMAPIFTKSLSGLLRLQEGIAERWLAQNLASGAAVSGD